MTQLLPNGKQQFIDINGKPLVGGKVFTFEVATNTSKLTYQDSALTIPNTNPVILDARGQCAMYGSGSYRQLVQDATGVQIWDQVVLDPGGAASDALIALKADLANATDPTKGASLIGYNNSTVYKKLQERIDVTDHWLAGDTNWSNAIDRCIALAQSATSSNTPANFVVPRIWFPRTGDPTGAYAIERPIFCTLPMQFDGDGARIYALATFVGKTIPLQAGGTEVNSSMIIYLNGNKLNVAGTLRWRAQVGRGLIIDCADIAGNGIYIERMPYSNINPVIRGCLHDGVQIGPYCWGMNLDSIVIESFSDFGIHFLQDSACNGMSIKNPKIWGQFKTPQAGILFDASAEANGVSVSGGFIEKMDYGVLIAAGNGPMIFDGVDFEQCTFANIRASSAVYTGQKIGPIDVLNCFLNSNTAATGKIYADWAIINVEGCRMFPGSYDFQTDTAGRGVINARNNLYMAGGVVGIVPGTTICFEDSLDGSKKVWNYQPQKVAAFIAAWDLRNYQYRDNPTLQSSGLSFNSFYVGGATGQYVSRSEWFISEYQFVTNPAVLNKRIGVALANDSGQNSFQPSVNNTTTLGAPGALWTTVYAVNGAISSSDARMKTEVRPLAERETSAAAQIGKEIGAYNWLHSMDEKGDAARLHIGLTVQRAMEIMDSFGLDPFGYGFICYDKWDAIEPKAGDSEKGIEDFPGRDAGDSYGFRYDQLSLFIAAGLEARMAKLENQQNGE